jgi:hypothetical protein
MFLKNKSDMWKLAVHQRLLKKNKSEDTRFQTVSSTK